MERPLAFDPATPYRELRDPPLPDELRALALDCFAAQRRALGERRASPATAHGGTGDGRAAGDGDPRGPRQNHPDDHDREHATWPAATSGAELARILASGRTIGGIVGERAVATAIPFNARLAHDVVWSRDVAARRRALDAALARWVRSLFASGRAPVLVPAGMWWYPPGTYFGWHTNHAYPGWRLYLSHAEEEGRAIFRYREPASGAVVTSPDARWHLRFFAISAERPLWHAIASATHRFSVGWHVRPWSLRAAARARVKQMVERATG